MKQDFMIELDRICEKDPVELTAEDIAFLKARSLYMTDSQTEKFAIVLNEKKSKTVEQPAEEQEVSAEQPTEEKPKKKSKK